MKTTKPSEQCWLEGIARGVRDAVVAIGASGMVFYLNPQAENLTGWTNEDARGVPFETVLPLLTENSPSRSEHPVLKEIHEGTSIHLATHKLITRNGSEQMIEDSRSQSAAVLLGQKGFKKVYNVLGGTDVYRMAGFALSQNGH